MVKVVLWVAVYINWPIRLWDGRVGVGISW